jgi:tetratricopeptide (TPR) repeat protein
MKRCLSLLPSLLTLVLPAAVSAQNNVIIGKVRSTTGQPLNNAIVELRRGGGVLISQTVTRNDGDFAFTGLVEPEYEIGVNLTGFEPAVERAVFRLPAGVATVERLRVEIILKPMADQLLAPPGVSFAQEVPRPARTAYEKAVDRFKEGKSEEGIALLREATTIFSDYFDAHFALALELYRTEKYDESLHSLERARAINDREGAVYHLFGLLMTKQRKLGVAEYAFREAARLNPNSIAARFYHGVVLIELGTRGSTAQGAADLNLAEKQLVAAWDLSQRRLSGVHLQLYRLHTHRGEKAAAIKDLENFLKAEPNAKNAAEIRAQITRLRAGK